MLVSVDFVITLTGGYGLIGGSDTANLAMFENSLKPIAFSALN